MRTSALFSLLLAVGGQAVPPKDGAVRDEVYRQAQTLLDASDQRLASASTLHASYVDVSAFPAKFKDLRQTGTVDFARPGKLRVAIRRSRRPEASQPWQETGNDTLRVGDGNTAYSVFLHRYSTQVRSERSLRLDAEDETPLTVAFFGGAGSPAGILRAGHDRGELGNLTVQAGKVAFDSGKDHYEANFGADGLVREFSRTRATGASRTWTLEKIGLDKRISDRTFAYQPPADALPYERGAGGDALEIGEKAPDFTVAGVDGAPIHLSDFAGKVVVLKFWATWCWPCNQSMPSTEAFAKGCARDSVVTLAVAIKDSRSGFDHWVKAHPQYRDIRFAFEDPTRSPVSSAYGISATPTTLVVGRDGSIIDLVAGFSGPDPRLDRAVAVALGQRRASDGSR